MNVLEVLLRGDGEGGDVRVPMSMISEYRGGGSGSEEAERAHKTADSSRAMVVCIANVGREVDRVDAAGATARISCS